MDTMEMPMRAEWHDGPSIDELNAEAQRRFMVRHPVRAKFERWGFIVTYFTVALILFIVDPRLFPLSLFGVWAWLVYLGWRNAKAFDANEPTPEDRQLLESASERSVMADIAIVQSEIVTARDRGVLSVEGPLVRFRGYRTTFCISREDIDPLKPFRGESATRMQTPGSNHRLAMARDSVGLIIRTRPTSQPVSSTFDDYFNFWRGDSSTDPVPVEMRLLPPTGWYVRSPRPFNATQDVVNRVILAVVTAGAVYVVGRSWAFALVGAIFVTVVMNSEQSPRSRWALYQKLTQESSTSAR